VADGEDEGQWIWVSFATEHRLILAHVVDDRLKHESDNPSIGLILCQDKKKVVAEYTLRGVNKPIGISEYELTRALPDELKSALPTIEEIETELEKGGREG